MTALGVCQQGKLLVSPPTDQNYHKLCQGDKENTILCKSFYLKRGPDGGVAPGERARCV
jgi:hypothetical protein